MNTNILIVEDDPHIARLLQTTLSMSGYESEICSDGVTAVHRATDGNFDLILLDIMLPGMDGFAVMEQIRPLGIPVIFLTAMQDTLDKVHGLRLGAEDYIVKPFETKEVLARIKAVLRRIGKDESNAVKEVHYDKLSINLTNYELKVDGVQIDTPPKEMELLYHLASNPNRVFTRDQLLVVSPLASPLMM